MDFYLGLILPSAFPWAPENFLPCDGRMLNIMQYQALYSLLGTTYGGNGQTTFALPDLRGRVPVGAYPTPGGGNATPPAGVTGSYPMGHPGGAETTTLTTAQMPAHNHAVKVATTPANQASPTGNYPAPLSGTTAGHPPQSVTVEGYANPAGNNPGTLAPDTVSSVGGNQPFSNLQPYLAVNWIICVQGLYPQRP